MGLNLRYLPRASDCDELLEITAYDADGHVIAVCLVSAADAAAPRIPGKFWNQCEPLARKRLESAVRVTWRRDDRSPALEYSDAVIARLVKNWRAYNKASDGIGSEINDRWSLK